MLLDRRAVLTSLLSLPISHLNGDSLFDTWVDVICSSTPTDFRRSIKASNNFLYRGTGDDEKTKSFLVLNDGKSRRVLVNNPEPDLLVEGTYDDPSALEYFQCLEHQLRYFPARPSTGHIATSDPMEAGKWGDVVSVWPLGNEMAFVWPKDYFVFYSDRSTDRKNCKVDTFFLNESLERALNENREVLFYSCFTEGYQKSLRSAFLTVPKSVDERLKMALESRNYGL